MNETQENLKLAQSKVDLKIFVAVVAAALILIMAARTPLDTDFWWHLRAGETTWLTGKPLLTDMFTFTKTGQAWINHSWLGEVIYYLVYNNSSFPGVGLLVAIVATAAMMLVYVQLSGPDLVKAAVILLSSIVAAGIWSPRPQLFSLLLFAAVYLVIYVFKWKQKDRLWLLPILFILWSNLHAGFSLGFLLLGAIIAGEGVNFLTHSAGESNLAWRQLRKLILWTVVCGLVVMINPNGINTWLIQFKTVGIDTLRRAIDEWASPDFHQMVLQPFLWLLFALLAAVGLSGRKMDGLDLIGLIGFGYLALMAKRNFAPFAVFAAPVLARHVEYALQRWRTEREQPSAAPGRWQRLLRRTSGQSLPQSLRKLINLTFFAILALVGIGKLVFVTHPVMMEKAMKQYYPVGVVETMQNNNLRGNIFNSYGWGGYIEWKLRDSLVYIDGRTDLFGDEMINEWIDTIQVEPGWQETLAKWNVDYCIIEPNRPLAGALEQQGTEILYSDSVSVLFKLKE